MSVSPGNAAARDVRVPLRLRCGPTTVGLATGLAALALYAATGSRGVEWQDSGVHQFRIVTGTVAHPFGLALTHPLHHWLGRAVMHIALGNPFHRLNLLSGVCGAVGVGVLAGLVVGLTRSSAAGALAGTTLALAHSYWQMSAVTETYTLAAALMTIECAVLLRYVQTQRPAWLVALFAVNGLHVADHLLGLLTLAPYGVLLLERIVRRRVGLRWLPLALAAWAVTASPYWTLVVAQGVQTADWSGTLRSALFGGSPLSPGWVAEVLNTHVSIGQLKLAALALGYCFPSAAGLIALVGLWHRFETGGTVLLRRVLLAQTALIVAFVARYTIQDVYTYFVPVCVLTALWFGCGVASLLRRWPRARNWMIALLAVHALVPPAVYAWFPGAAREHGWLRVQLRKVPYRDPYVHFFRPWRVPDASADVFADEVLRRLGENGWLLGDVTTAFPAAAVHHVRNGPAGVRIYLWRDCLTPWGAGTLTDDELRAFVEQGGRVLAVPAPVIEGQIPQPLLLDKTDVFWRVVAKLDRPAPAES